MGMPADLNSIVPMWWTWMWAVTWQTSLLAGLVYIVDITLRRWTCPRIRYALWLLVFLKLLLPPTLSSPLSFAGAYQGVASSLQAVPAVSVASAASVASTASVAYTLESVAAVSQKTITYIPAAPDFLPTMFFTIWLTGVVILCAWFVFRVVFMRRFYRSGLDETPVPAWLTETVVSAAAKLGLERLPRIVITDKVDCPGVYGVFTSFLLIPESVCKGMTPQEAEHIILHELVHIQRRDPVVHAVTVFIALVFWFNPFVWLSSKRLRYVRELCCDTTVSSLLREETPRYRGTLLSMARQLLDRKPTVGMGLLGLVEEPASIVVRLRWLERNPWRRKHLHSSIVMLVTVLFGVSVLPMASAHQPKVYTDPLTETTSVLSHDEIVTPPVVSFYGPKTFVPEAEKSFADGNGSTRISSRARLFHELRLLARDDALTPDEFRDSLLWACEGLPLYFERIDPLIDGGMTVSIQALIDCTGSVRATSVYGVPVRFEDHVRRLTLKLLSDE